MIFSVQRYLEDHFNQRGLTDVDQYAIRIANVFAGQRANSAEKALVRDISKLPTAFYSRNRGLDRKQFETEIARRLRSRFKKKVRDSVQADLLKAIPTARARLQAKRRSIAQLLLEFKMAVEGRGIGSYWIARRKGKLHSYPERIAQDQLAIFAKGVLGPKGLVIREFESGIGYVDVGISFGAGVHLIELKVLKGGSFTGTSQLAQYMRTEGKTKGWLVVMDLRSGAGASAIPRALKVAEGTIRVLCVRINPVAPSKQN